MTRKHQLLGSAAAIALSAAFGASVVYAQATATTNLGIGETIATTGTLTAVNVQKLLANPTATTTGNLVTVNIVRNDGVFDTVTSALSGTNNAISASATGNSSASAAVLAFAPTTAGDTAVVGNLQSVETNTISASSSGDTHSILVENTGLGVRTFTGTALLDNNDTSASATGNAGTSRIDIANGLNITQAAAGQATAAIDETLLATPDNAVSGDLVVSSSQQIDGVEHNDVIGITGLVTGATTTTTIEDLGDAATTGGTVTVSGSDQGSTATGNAAANSIVSGGTTANITGSAVVSNLQSIDPAQFPVNITATTTGSEIGASAGAEAVGVVTGNMLDSTITVSGNTQSSGATGNDSTQAITLNASTITGEGAAASSLDNGGAAGVQLLASGDAVIANVQREGAGTFVVGVTSDNVIGALSANNTTNSTVDVNGNSQTASATGARTSNALSLTSGATQSAAGVVASVQNGLSTVDAMATLNTIVAQADEDVTDSSLLTTGNAIRSTATGGDATNDLSVTNGTNNLSAGTNAGTTVANDPAFGDQPNVVAGQVVTNDQSRAGSVTASSTDNQIVSQLEINNTIGIGIGTGNVLRSTVTTDGNSLSASATGQTADNGIDLAFNDLVGTISGAGTGTVASVANEQDMLTGSSVTARNVGLDGLPVLTRQNGFSSNVNDSSLSTSDNTVSATARGNVTTGNDVVADGTNVSSGDAASPSITALTGVVSAGGSFVSASAQTSGATILATQNNVAGTTSNTIETQVANALTDSTLVTDDNLLSSSATANTANNSVALGSGTSALIGASGTVANFQGTTVDGSVTAELGILGIDPVAGFTSSNGSAGPSTASNINFNTSSGVLTVVGTPVTVDFANPLQPEEVAILSGLGFTIVDGDTVTIPAGSFNLTGKLTGITVIDPSTGVPGDEQITVGGFNVTGTPGSFNGAGVIARLDADSASFGQINRSTVSVSGNAVVGDATGNAATNAVSAEATSVAGPALAADASVNPSDADVAPTGAELATANVQVNASALSTTVAATFGIIDDLGDLEVTLNSSQTLESNLQQSFATANRAANSVSVTATNTDAATALESSQISDAAVTTTSDTQVVANVGSLNSSLDMNLNRNESVANGNVVSNSVDVSATNLNAGTGNDASAAATVVSAGNVLSSTQAVTNFGAISASADTDVFNQDASTVADPLVTGSVTQSGNVTIAQATGNQTGAGGNSLTLGDAGTANNDRTGALVNVQTVLGENTITAQVDQSVRVELDQFATVPVQQSSIVQDGNTTSALARSNVANNSVTVDGANINGGAGGDASFDVVVDTLTGAQVLSSSQSNTFDVTATTLQSQVRLSSANSNGNAIDGSTISQSGNASTATALANTAVNTLSSGANAANVAASTALGNVQDNRGVVSATGGSAVGVFATGNGTDPSGITGTSVDISGNVSASNAVGNQAQNTLSASGANIASGNPVPTLGNATLDASGLAGIVPANAGNLLLSTQSNGGAIDSANNTNTVTIDASAATGTGAAASGSTLSVTGNAVEARATANLALNNSVSVGDMSTAATNATGLVGNFQLNTLGGAVTASATTQTTVTLNGAGAAGALLNGTADVSGNSALALARGNVSQNVLNAEGSNVGTGSANATVSAGLPDSGILNASFGVFNEQVQQAAVDASSTGARFAVNATSATGAALNGASASVSGNSVQASGFGNVATNSLTLTALNGGGNDATAAIFNGQSNEGAITALATGASIGVFSTGGVVSASAGVAGNSISANAVGNFSSSTVTRRNR